MAVLTTSDILKINTSEELIGLIDDVIAETPELGFFGASPVTKNSYKTLVATGLPSTGFRDPTSYRTFSDGVIEQRTVDCKYLDASWLISQALAQQADWGKDFVCSLQAKQHLQSAFFHLCQQIWYGTGADSSGFNGLASFIDAVVDSSSVKQMVIDANSGSTVSDASSVFAVRTGIDAAQLAWGSEGKFDEGDITEQLITKEIDSSLAGQWAYAQKLGGWVGLQVTSKWAAARITNLSATSNKNGLTDNLLYELISKFPAGRGPHAFFMSRRSLEQLRKSRTATNATGEPAPTPTSVGGIPIIATDAISNAETYTSSSSSSGGSGT